ncbi:uncharacterized protein LOC141700979, partial [Apium graveolens]
MPSKLWGEAARHAVYIINRLPTQALSGKTPYEVWTEKKPDLGTDVIFEEVKGWSWDAQKEAQDQRGPFIVLGTQSTEERDITNGEDPSTQRIDSMDSMDGYHTDSAISNEFQSNTMSPRDTSVETEPRKFRSLSAVYDETEETELADELMLLGVEEPTNYREATIEKAWKEAMIMEIDAIDKNNTWKLVELPVDYRAIGLKCIYKLKRDSSGQ